VVDGKFRPIGVITHGDLIRKGGLPLRLGLLAESDQNHHESILMRLDSKRAAEVMTMPVVIIPENQPLSEAVNLMLTKGVKRLPVVDEAGCLSGILSRLDIFRTVMRETPDWNAFKAQKIEVGQLKRVGDILRRDMHTVSPETTLNDVIRVIDDNDIQRVAVIDTEGKLLGLISDRDLLRYFKPEQEEMWHLLARLKHPFKQDSCRTDLRRRLAETNAAEVMTIELITVREEMLIEEAIELMINKELKRLPVIGATNRFKGMISRDSLLRTGFGRPV
jgi:CBS domain-containing protein